MTTAELKEWMQAVLDANPGDDGNFGDAWREIESLDLLDDIGVQFAVDPSGHDFIFKCEDGLLASYFEIGIEEETIWMFTEGEVEDNMRFYSYKELDSALGRARAVVLDLEEMFGE